MARLEYRSFGEDRSAFPLLYYYDRIDPEEIALRFACDYFIKEGRVYETTSSALEPELNVIYVQEAAGERALSDALAEGRRRDEKGIRIELRQYSEDRSRYPVVHVFRPSDRVTALLYLQAHFVTAGGIEWERTSTEIDEDREVYVVYAVPASEA